MAKAERAIEVDVTPERFAEVLQDYARYPEFLPDVKAVRVGEQRGEAVEVTYWLDARIKVIELTLQHERRGPREFAWRLVRDCR